MKKNSGFPEMTDEIRKELEAVEEMSDDQIDTSDIPEWSAKDFARSVPFSSIYKPRKKQITARLDADVLTWLKSHGKGYQTYMNELLRKDMMEEMSKQD